MLRNCIAKHVPKYIRKKEYSKTRGETQKRDREEENVSMIKIQWCETNWYKYLMNQKDFLTRMLLILFYSLSVVNRSLTSSHQMISNLTFFQLYGFFSILIINDLFCHSIKALLNFFPIEMYIKSRKIYSTE